MNLSPKARLGIIGGSAALLLAACLAPSDTDTDAPSPEVTVDQNLVNETAFLLTWAKQAPEDQESMCTLVAEAPTLAAESFIAGYTSDPPTATWVLDQFGKVCPQ